MTTRIPATAVLALALSLPGPGSAEPIDYATYMRWTGTTLALPDTARAIELAGDVGYVAAARAGLVVLDLSDPDTPAIVTTLDLPGVRSATDVTVKGDYAYLTLGFDGLVTVDVSDPAAPFVASHQIPEGFSLAAQVMETRLLVALTRLAPDGRLIAYDILGSPSFPQEVGRVPTPRQAFEVIAGSRLAYVPDVLCLEFGCSGGLGVYRVTDADPIEIGYRGTGPFDRLAVVGRYAHVVSSSVFGYRIYDVGDPSLIQLVSEITTVRPKDVLVNTDRDLAFLTGDGLEVVDIADVTSPVHLGTVHTPPGAIAQRVVLMGDRALLGDGLVLNVADVGPASPAPLLGGTDTPGSADDVDVSGTFAVVADETSLRLYDVSDPGDPSFAGSLGGAYADVVVNGTLAYALAVTGDLHVIDISLPKSPQIVGTVVSPGTPLAIARSDDGGYVYASYLRVGATDGVLRVFDVHAPKSPTLVRGLDTGTTVEAIAVHVAGTRLYVSVGLVLELDITDPENPVSRRVLQAPGSVTAFATDDAGGYAVSRTGDRSWISAFLFDTTTPAGSLQIPGPAQDITVAGGVAYVASGACGVNVVDVTDPTALDYIGGADTPADARAVARFGDVGILVADGPSGLRLVSPQRADAVGVDPIVVPSVATHLGPVVPNPLRRDARLPLTVSGTGTVRLEIFDAAGRRVRALLDDAPLAAGSHVLTWDGRTDAGIPLAPGTYFVRLNDAGHTDVRRVVVVR